MVLGLTSIVTLHLVIMMLLIGLDINSFIIMSGLIEEERIEMTARHILMVSLKSLKHFLSLAGIIMMVYISLIFPIIGMGITISPMAAFQIPNFITSVIYNNPLYFSLYVAAIGLLTYVSFRFIFVFHYILISGDKVGSALKQSAALTKRYPARVFFGLIGKAISKFVRILLPMLLGFALLSGLVFWLSQANDLDGLRFLLLFVLLILAELVAVFALLVMPLLITAITELFYELNAKEGRPIRMTLDSQASQWDNTIKHKIKTRTKALASLALVASLLVNALMALGLTLGFEDIFYQQKQIEIIAHRAGGDLGAENTVEGIEEAAKAKAAWAEIDVQRTLDGAYVLNHDGDFARVAGDSRSSSEMTLAEIKTLKVKNEFDPKKAAQPVPTIEEIVAAAKGKIGLFIELKGKTADTQMADDMVALIKAQGIEKEAALLSLDYSLIQYIEENYPDIQTGYLYYFAVGQTKDLVGDFLIMEEREATPEKVAELKASGKKVIVWTVNTDESVAKFVSSDVDGIITDYVLKVKQGLADRDNRSDLDIIVDTIFGA